MRNIYLAAVVAASLLLQDGCTKPEMMRGGGAPAPARPEARETAAGRPDTLARAETLTGTEEGLTRDARRDARTEPERVDAIRPDTFVVEEVETPAKSTEESAVRFEIGYRVQVAATSDRDSADRIRAELQRETGLAAYIDSEEGLFKIRVGDFADRKAAAILRTKLEARYPGAWIVRTAIRTERPSPGKGD